MINIIGNTTPVQYNEYGQLLKFELLRIALYRFNAACYRPGCGSYQADALAAEGVEADSFILLNVPDDMLVSRVVGRRLDPDTGDIYHVEFNPPPAEIVGRLVAETIYWQSWGYK